MKMIDKLASLLGYSRVGRRESWWPVGSIDTGVGFKITPDYAMRVATVMGCVKVLAETLASLPLHVYRTRADGGKDKDRAHYLYNLLHDVPNRWQTSFEFREMMQGHLCLRGNAYARIVYDRREIPVELIPLHPDRITISRLADGTLEYVERDPVSGGDRKYRQPDILHVRGLSGDGIKGLSPIQYAAVTIGLALAGEQLGASFFRDGAIMSGAFEHPDQLSPKAKTNLEQSLAKKHGGASKAYKIIVLEEGMKWNQIGIKPDEGQFIESRKLAATDICAIFRVPPHLVANLERATFSNIEHQSIDFVTHTIRPWAVRWEQAIQRDLFDSRELGVGFAEFRLDGLLRGDSKARALALSKQFEHGVISQDDWREIENMNPLPEGQGQTYYVPLNLRDSSKPQVLKSAPARNNNDDNEALYLSDAALCAWIENTAQRIAAAEVRAVDRRRQGGPYATSFRAWLLQFSSRHGFYVRESLTPIFDYTSMPGLDRAIGEITGGVLTTFIDTEVGRETTEARVKTITELIETYIGTGVSQ